MKKCKTHNVHLPCVECAWEWTLKNTDLKPSDKDSYVRGWEQIDRKKAIAAREKAKELF